jgi:hypothetical protein
MFENGTKLRVTDNTGKPFGNIIEIEIIGYDEFGYRCILLKTNDTTGEDEVGETCDWDLERAIEENRIFVEVL